MVFNRKKRVCFNCNDMHYLKDKCPWDYCIFCWSKLEIGIFHNCNRQWVTSLPQFRSIGAYRRAFFQFIEQKQNWDELKLIFDQYYYDAHPKASVGSVRTNDGECIVDASSKSKQVPIACAGATLTTSVNICVHASSSGVAVYDKHGPLPNMKTQKSNQPCIKQRYDNRYSKKPPLNSDVPLLYDDEELVPVEWNLPTEMIESILLYLDILDVASLYLVSGRNLKKIITKIFGNANVTYASLEKCREKLKKRAKLVKAVKKLKHPCCTCDTFLQEKNLDLQKYLKYIKNDMEMFKNCLVPVSLMAMGLGEDDDDSDTDDSDSGGVPIPFTYCSKCGGRSFSMFIF